MCGVCLVQHSAISVTLLLLRCASSRARSENYEQRAAAPLITNMDLPPHWTLASVLWMLLIGAAEDCLGEEGMYPGLLAFYFYGLIRGQNLRATATAVDLTVTGMNRGPVVRDLMRFIISQMIGCLVL